MYKNKSNMLSKSVADHRSTGDVHTKYLFSLAHGIFIEALHFVHTFFIYYRGPLELTVIDYNL